MGELFVDTNVFLYAFGKEHRYKLPCSRILQKIEVGELPACTSSEILQEILYRNFQIEKKEEGVKIVKHLLSYFPKTLDVGKEEVESALQFLGKYKELMVRDAIHVATMLKNGITIILSADKDFDRVKEVKRIDPLEVV